MTDVYNRLQLPPAPPESREWKIGMVQMEEKWFSDGGCDLYIDAKLFKHYHWHGRPPFVEVKFDI